MSIFHSKRPVFLDQKTKTSAVIENKINQSVKAKMTVRDRIENSRVDAVNAMKKASKFD